MGRGALSWSALTKGADDASDWGGDVPCDCVFVELDASGRVEGLAAGEGAAEETVSAEVVPAPV